MSEATLKAGLTLQRCRVPAFPHLRMKVKVQPSESEKDSELEALVVHSLSHD
jgi:hypothetical protein